MSTNISCEFELSYEILLQNRSKRRIVFYSLLTKIVNLSFLHNIIIGDENVVIISKRETNAKSQTRFPSTEVLARCLVEYEIFGLLLKHHKWRCLLPGTWSDKRDIASKLLRFCKHEITIKSMQRHNLQNILKNKIGRIGDSSASSKHIIFSHLQIFIFSITKAFYK